METETKIEKKKTKSPVGLIILLIVLALLIVPPIVAYAYLSVSASRIEKNAPGAVESAWETRYAESGSVEVSLSDTDVLPFLETLGLREEMDALIEEYLPEQLVLNAYYPIFSDDGITLYVSAKAFGFLPLPLKAECSLTGNGSEVTVSDVVISIGEKISLPWRKSRTGSAWTPPILLIWRIMTICLGCVKFRFITAS